MRVDWGSHRVRGGHLSKRSNGESSRSVVLRKVLSNLGVKVLLLDQINVSERSPVLSTDELDVSGDGLGGDFRLETELGNAGIDSLLSHLSVSGPLSASNGDKTRLGVGDEMVSDKRLGVLGVGSRTRGRIPDQAARTSSRRTSTLPST